MYCKRDPVVYSNLSTLFPIGIVLFYHFKHKTAGIYVWLIVAVEVLQGLVSGLYHACDPNGLDTGAEQDCNQLCFANSYDLLQQFDFGLTPVLATTVFLFGSMIPSVVHTFALLASALAGMYFGGQSGVTRDVGVLLTGALGVSAILLTRFWRHKGMRDMPQDWKKSFPWGTSLNAFILLALFMYINLMHIRYYIAHSIWHGSISLGRMCIYGYLQNTEPDVKGTKGGKYDPVAVQEESPEVPLLQPTG